MELSAEAQQAALAEHGAEFAIRGRRLVRPRDQRVEPDAAPDAGLRHAGAVRLCDGRSAGFRAAHGGLNQVPEPLWWLLGAIVSFYFGAREAYYFRNRTIALPASAPSAANAPVEDRNAAVDEWRTAGG